MVDQFHSDIFNKIEASCVDWEFNQNFKSQEILIEDLVDSQEKIILKFIFDDIIKLTDLHGLEYFQYNIFETIVQKIRLGIDHLINNIKVLIYKCSIIKFEILFQDR